MHRHLSGYLAALVLVSTLMASDGARAGSFTRGCAARDREILMLIEDREDRSAVSAETLSDALYALLDARMICHEGRVMDAIALYDSIAREIAAETAQPARRE